MATFKAGKTVVGGLSKALIPKPQTFSGPRGIGAGWGKTGAPPTANQPFMMAAPMFQAPSPGPAAAAGRDLAAESAANPDVWKDSTYNNTLANLLSQKSAGETAIDTAGRRAVEDRDKNLGLLKEGRGKARTQTTQSANNRGLFYSGYLGKQLGDVDTDYGRREGDVATAYTRGEEERATARSGLGAAYDQAQRDAGAQAVDRWIGAAQGTESESTPSLDAFLAAMSRWNTGTNARGR